MTIKTKTMRNFLPTYTTKQIKTQTINIDYDLWEDAKKMALLHHQESVSVVVSHLLEAWNQSPNKQITLKQAHLKKERKVRRSLYCDLELWQETKIHAKTHFGKSGSFIIETLLRNWVFDEKKRKVENPNQARLI